MSSAREIELAARYAAAASARAAVFLRARHVPDALRQLGLVRPQDRLIVCADDFAEAFAERFPRESLFFVDQPSPQAFQKAMEAYDAGDAGMSPNIAQERGRRASATAAARPTDPAADPAAHGSRTFWLVNSIGGFGLRVPDLRALAAAAREAGAFLIVDNTVPSCFGCEPLKLGAHFSFEALDRLGAGALPDKLVAAGAPFSHASRKRPADPLADAAYRLLGACAEQLRAAGCADGLTDAEADLIAQGLDTLPERMQRHMDHARALAEYLRCHPSVARVHYPGLPQHPDHAQAANVLLHGGGPAVDFELARGAAGRFLSVCRAAHRQAPAGGPLTRISAPKGDEAQYLRLFAGVDDPLDIVDSLDQALRLFCNPPEP